MLILFPILAFILLLILFAGAFLGFRQAYLRAACVWAALLIVIVEVLSIPRVLSPVPLALAWASVCLGCLLFGKKKLPQGVHALESSFHRFWQIVTGDQGSHRFLAFGTLLLLLLVGIAALVSPPNTWDAMEYHMPRVVFWMSNHTVEFYPTADYQQLIFAPNAEYEVLNSYLLYGSDRLANLVQFFSFFGCILAASSIAGSLGAGLRGQLLAAVACATIPSAVLEASGAMNSVAVSFWVAATVYFVLEWREHRPFIGMIFVGLSIGVALLTKGTAYVVLPFVLLACWLSYPSARKAVFLKYAVLALGLVLLLNGQQYRRCYDLTGSPLGQPFPNGTPRLKHLSIERVSLLGTAGNIIRNISVHLCTPSPAVNARIESGLRWSMEAIGENPDDPRRNWLGDPFRMSHFSTNETLVGDPAQVLLLSWAIVFILFGTGMEIASVPSWYALGIAGAFLLFCATLRWHMWMSRLQLPLFVLGAALIGYALQRTRFQRLASVTVSLLLIVGVGYSLTNRLRALVPSARLDSVYHPRQEMYFNDGHQEQSHPYVAAANFVNSSSCQSVSIDSVTNNLEFGRSPKSNYVYPVLALIHAGVDGRTVRYSGVANLTTRYAQHFSDYEPCAVICIDCGKKPMKWEQYRSVGGRASVFDFIVVFTALGEQPNPGHL